MTQKKKGFTLIELMVVMAIIAVLSVLMIGAIQMARSTATETTNRSNGKTIQTALEGNFAKYRAYCGKTGEIACATYSFATAAGDTVQGISPALTSNLGVKLGTSNCPTGAANYAGGGTVTIATNSYSIVAYNSSCDDDLPDPLVSQ